MSRVLSSPARLYNQSSGLSSGLLASLNAQSLNQFAESVSKAEALSAEMASIHKGLQDIVASPESGDSPTSEAELAVENAGMTRL
jgi:hypothetical protein